MSNLADEDTHFSFLEGLDIVDFYKKADEKSHSCMTGGHAQKTMLYADNPERVKLLIFDDFVARALVWKDDDGKTLLDRIYPNGGHHIDLYLKYAKKNDWIARNHQGAPRDGAEFDNKHIQGYFLGLQEVKMHIDFA